MMGKGRLEAFSDGVIAIIITIMVLELRVPHGAELADLTPLVPVLMSYILSFVFIGIYWNNHHYMLHVTKKVGGAVLWANLHLLFWLSLVPFVTAWMGENHFAPTPTALYGVVLVMDGIAYTILQRAILAQHGHDFILRKAVGRDFKGKVSIAAYIAAILLAVARLPQVAWGLYAAVALMWLVPDSRIEHALADEEGHGDKHQRSA